MKRREFITVLGGTAAWPFAARSQQKMPVVQPAIPVVGYLFPGSPETSAQLVAAFRKGLNETGFVENQNVAIEFRWAFHSRRVQLAVLAARYRIPVILPQREFVEAGGLMSYGTDIADSIRQVGIYTGKVLKGAKPADLPVAQSTKFEFVINLQTARSLGIDVPATLLTRADKVIE